MIKPTALLNIFFPLAILLTFSCEPEVEQPVNGGVGKLSFSQDTVFFDTIFTDTRSITKRLKVYNQENGAVNIEQIKIKNGNTFSLFIYGEKGDEFNDIQLLGKDSLLILIEAEIDRRDENTPFIISDELQVVSSEEYEVPLIAWGQEAIFLKDTVLSCDASFNSERPYVLYGSTVVDSLCTLTIDPGARIYAHFNAGLYIMGSIKANGEPKNRILFSNDRLDEGYENAPGQWRGIYILEGSTNNNILFTDIRNAEVGIRIGAPDDDDDYDLEVGHSIIENITSAGIMSFTSDIFIYNSLINNCGYASVAAVAGGNYRLWNNTMVNYSFDFFREDATLIISNNVYLADNSLLIAPLNIEMINNIIWGNLNDEIIFSEVEDAGFTTALGNNLIKTTSDTLAGSNLINADPLFLAPSEYNYRLDSLSPAIDAGRLIPGITWDIEGKERTGSPDIGAYEKF